LKFKVFVKTPKSVSTMRRSLGLEPCSKGVSVVCEMSVGHTGSTCILLGSASNAAAAVSGTLGSYSVTQIICVASSKNATTLRARWRQAIADEGEYENQATSSKVAFQAFNMSDWLRPDDVIDIAKDVEGPLTALVNAATANIKQVAEGESGNNESMVELGQERKHAVLVHCDMGINRAPTVALAFLVQMGHTLRSAYFHVLQSRLAWILCLHIEMAYDSLKLNCMVLAQCRVMRFSQCISQRSLLLLGEKMSTRQSP